MTVDSTNSASGIRSYDSLRPSAKPNSDTELGSQDFLLLLTTQLQNQDPLSPMKNEQFLAQLAQMSTVNGIESLNTTMKSVAAASSSALISEASSMLGQRALVQGEVAQAHQGQIDGRIYVAEKGANVKVTYSDASTGELLHSQVLTDQPAGAVDFSWDNAPGNGRKIKVSASVSGETGTEDAKMSVYARIEGVEVDPRTNGMTLQVQGYGKFKGSDITALR